MMLRALLFLTVASILVILGANLFTGILHFLAYLHHMLSCALSHFFAGSIGLFIRQILGLIIIPLAAGGIVEGISVLLLRQRSPYFYSVVWAAWLMLAVNLAH